MRDEQVSILQGDAFVVSDQRGDIENTGIAASGLFYRDTRHLSRWQVRINGRRLDVLSADTLEYDEAVFFLVEPHTVYRNPSLSMTRRREVAGGMREHLEAHNHGPTEIQLEVSLLFDADFADLFEVKDQLSKSGEHYRRHLPDGIALGYRREDFCRETYIRAEGAYFTEESLTFRVDLAPHAVWSTQIDVRVGDAPDHPLPQRIHRPHMPASLAQWLAAAPHLESDWYDLLAIYDRSLRDLAALRFYPESVPDASLPAAGLPWFMALFGRDSLIASYQTLPFVPELTRTTLRALAAQQATGFDDFRDAEPGKILHELRHGELAHFAERPHSPYYGSADATPLFLIVLDEYERWTGDTATVKELRPHALAALNWLDEYGDIDGDGYIEYVTRNPRTGLVNQCWKDSWNSIVYPDGTLSTLPRATCEIQGYAYDARRRAARLAREVWGDADLAVRLDATADRLYERFNEDFWVEDQRFYALALDGDKNPVPTLSSNIGHLLWSGIVPPDRVSAVAEHLLDEGLFSGWGVRTLSDGQQAYNPVGYHNGTVWPHDTAFAVAGLARYGRRGDANFLATSLLDAALHFNHRLPEAFAGYPRALTRVPVRYPTACSPQAWSSGAPLLLLRIMLGMEPSADDLLVDPVLPVHIGRIALRGVPGRWGRSDADSSLPNRPTP